MYYTASLGLRAGTLFPREFAAFVTCLGDLRLGFSYLSTVVGHSAQRGLPGLNDLRSEARLLVAPLEGEWKHVVRDRVEDLKELGGDDFAKVNSHFPLVQGIADIQQILVDLHTFGDEEFHSMRTLLQEIE